MAPSGHDWSDERVEQRLGNLLRAGVLLAAAVVACGGIVYLIRHGTERTDLGRFHGEDVTLRKPVGIVRSALTLHGRGLIQLGLLLLIATPVARVAFSAFAFGRQRDWTFVVITLVVLLLLLCSLLWGHPEGGQTPT
jgi:uncharacterized membrane protein